MFNNIAVMYITILPIVLAGVSNMIFCKTALYKRHNTPIDLHKKLSDGHRIFGDNKAYIGFISMVAFTIIWQLIMGLLDSHSVSEIYAVNRNTAQYNIIMGALSGLAYALFELPNSFIKRRLDIQPGKTASGILGVTFFIIDQMDSVIGIIIVFHVYSGIPVLRCFGYLILGSLTHIGVNLALYALKIRRNI